MKKLIVFLFIATVSVASFAQSNFSIGIKGGASFYSYGSELAENNPNINSYSQETEPGYNIGVFSKIRLGSILYLQPEVFYARKSIKQDISSFYKDPLGTVVPMNFTKNDIMHYIDIPVLLNATIFDFTYAGKLYGIAGPTASFLTSVKEEYSNNFGIIEGDNKESIQNSIENDINTVNMTVQAGIGYEVRKFHVDLRYERGLTSMSKQNFDMTLDNIMLSVGLRFL